MSSKKAALGCIPPNLLKNIPRTFPEPRGIACSGTIAGAHRKRLRQRGQAAWGGIGGKVWPPRKRLERCPGMLGLGFLPPCRAGARWGPWGLAGKPCGNCYNITPGWTKATPHSTSTPPWRGTFNSFAWCSAHLQKPDFLPSSAHTRSEPRHRSRCNELSRDSPRPCLAEGPCGHPLAITSPHTGMWDCYQHCLDLTQSSQTCARREPIPPVPCAPAG